jgi:Domain of unknown function (DUF4167)
LRQPPLIRDMNQPMRQGQQNRRGRGRTRKPQNPLARSYESNGPDVKIRGTAAHIAEKYMSLARDSLSSGDLVAAESYLQHAEHYSRIIMAAQSQLGPQGNQPGEGANGGAGYRPHWNADFSDQDDGGSDFEGGETSSGSNDMRGGGSNETRGNETRGGGSNDMRGNDGRGRGQREPHGHRGANGSEAPSRDSKGSDQADSPQPDENAPDQVS